MAPREDLAGFVPSHFLLEVTGMVATVTLNRPERKNPLTFASYAELTEFFRRLASARDVRAVVIVGAAGNFCSGGDVHEIIGPLVQARDERRMDELLAFTRMTGGLVAAMRSCPQPIVAAVDGTCAGAGAILAMASDVRFGTPAARTAFLFVRVGLSGADMGACALLPRIVGLGRAAELLYTGRFMSADEGLQWGFFNRIVPADRLQADAATFAKELADGPSFAHAMTKSCLHAEWAMPIDVALEHEAQAQAICMQTGDFARAYRAFVARTVPAFEGK
ncbi:MAG: 4-chlorobenzoyl coenzyme A dehalogenase [Gemmatimonadaceae bacterium]|nr:4-chlorobenzoyl coenzyme A dehalogenase [Gemmatimonadaceae bacterium]